jgi:hypothetical protein
VLPCYAADALTSASLVRIQVTYNHGVRFARELPCSSAEIPGGRAQAVAAITTNPAGAVASVATQAESLSTEIQALRAALNQLPPPDPPK